MNPSILEACRGRGLTLHEIMSRFPWGDVQYLLRHGQLRQDGNQIVTVETERPGAGEAA